MDLFTASLSLGLALNPISEGYVEISSTTSNTQDYICYANTKDYEHALFDTGADISLFGGILYAGGTFTGSTEYQHVTYNAGIQYKIKDFTPYLEFSGTYLNEEKKPCEKATSKIKGYDESEMNLRLGIKAEHTFIKFINLFGDFSLGYDFNNQLEINYSQYDSRSDSWNDKSIKCDYLSGMFRVNFQVGIKFFNMLSFYGGIQSWQTLGYSEDTGSIFGGSTPNMIRNDIGMKFKTNFKRFNPYVDVTYFCQHPEKPFDFYNKVNHTDKFLTEQFNFNNMEVKAGCEIRF